MGVIEGCDFICVWVFGLGLEGGLVNKVNCFIVEIRGVGIGGFGLVIEGFLEVKMFCKDNKDGSCIVEYIFFIFGDYDVNIIFGGWFILGSLFWVLVKDVVDFGKVKCLGLGLGVGVRVWVF